MRCEPLEPPREFEAGFDIKRTIKDCARIALDADEQVTFTTENSAEYDVCRKDFGFYATPSLNGRLPRFGLKPVLVKNRLDQYFVLLVEDGRHELFEKYRREEKLRIVAWLHSTEALKALDPVVGGDT